MQKLSIVAPCYNCEPYISELVECFLRQSVDNWELILVDDGSTDNTFDTISKYSESDERIKALKRNREPKGGDACRNIGFENATGYYICFIDSDDLVSDTFVEHRVKYMESNPSLDYSTFCAKVFIDGHKLPSYKDNVWTLGLYCNTSDILNDILSADYSFSVWNNIYKRDSIKDIHWDENLYVYQDFDFMFITAINGLKHTFAGLKEVDYYYRIYDSNSSHKNVCSSFISTEKRKSTLYLIDKVLNILDKREDSTKRKNQFLGLIIMHCERLAKAGLIDDLNDVFNICSRFYQQKDINKIESLLKEIENGEISKVRKIYIYYSLYRITKLQRFNIFHGLSERIKRILGK